MEKKPERRVLGRGLSALMADVNADLGAVGEGAARRADLLVPIEEIYPNPNQPRRDFDPASLDELADSIRQKGVIQPLILRKVGERRFEIVAGERRWRASQLAKLHKVPAVLRDYSDTEVLEVAIIENIQRADLNAVEEARAYRQLMERFGHTQERIAEALGRSRSHIANLLRLLALPDDVIDLLREGKLSAGHARALITSDRASELAKMIVDRGLSVREVEALMKKPAAGVTTKPDRKAGGDKDADTLAIEGDLSASIAMKVTIDHSAGGESGKLTISYENLDQLDFLCQVLGSSARGASK